VLNRALDVLSDDLGARIEDEPQARLADDSVERPGRELRGGRVTDDEHGAWDATARDLDLRP